METDFINLFAARNETTARYFGMSQAIFQAASLAGLLFPNWGMCWLTISPLPIGESK
jgi:hypothetical protein